MAVFIVIDSPYKRVIAWWPNDCPEFKPNADDTFYERCLFDAEVLGSEPLLPDSMVSDEQRSMQDAMTEEDVLRQGSDEQSVWSANETAREDDAFTPIRKLVLGEDRLTGSDKNYHDLAKEREPIRTAVSIVKADRPWAFLVFAGEAGRAPRLACLEVSTEVPITRLDDIASFLRKRLSKETETRELDKEAESQLRNFGQILERKERRLLPRRKQVAIDEMQLVLRAQIKKHFANVGIQQEINPAPDSEVAETDTDEALSDDAATKQLIEKVLDLLNPLAKQEIGENTLVLDFTTLADRWINFVRPVLQEEIQRKRKTTLVRLKDIRKPLSERKIALNDVQRLLNPDKLWIEPLHKRVVAAIIGIPEIGL